MMPPIEAVRAYWDAQPCNIRHSHLRPGSPEWSWEVSAWKYKVEPHIRGFADFPRWAGQQVLEIGCGIGTDTLEFARAGALVDAVDISPVSLQIAAERLRTFPNAILHCRSAESHLPNWSYDLIYSFGVLHHTPHPELILQQAFERLRPGGELRIMLYAGWSIKFLLRHQPEAQPGCPIARTYSARQARQLVEDAGFRVVLVHKTHIFPYRLADYLRHRLVRAFPYSAMPSWLFKWLERRLGHHLLLVAVRPL